MLPKWSATYCRKSTMVYLQWYTTWQLLDTYSQFSHLLAFCSSRMAPSCTSWSLVHTYKQLANQMRICVDGTVNMWCAMCEWFAYHSLQTEICQIFAQTRRELCVLCAVCSPQVHRKLIYHVPSANCLRTAGLHVCTGLNILVLSFLDNSTAVYRLCGCHPADCP